MRLKTKDEALDALIALFNEQTKKQNWDAAYGTSVETNIVVHCACGKSREEIFWADEVPASGMDELV